jgi:DNA-binding transcriptional MerR regulator
MPPPVCILQPGSHCGPPGPNALRRSCHGGHHPILDVSTATIRNRLKQFGSYLSAAARKKTGKRFTASDLATLRTIQGYIDDGLTIDEIPDLLTFTPEIVNGQDDTFTFEQQQPTNETAITAPQAQDFIQQALDNAAAQHQREIIAKDETIQILRDELNLARRRWWKFWV